MNFKLFLLVSCLCVHFCTSTEEFVAGVEKIERGNLLRLMYDALTTETSRHKTANKEFSEKYGQHQIELTYVSEDNGRLLISNEIISVDFSLASQFLKAFAESIKKLSIAYHLLPAESHKEIGRLVNVHCAETLEVFQVKMCKNGDLDEMEKPFKKVKNVAFDGDWLGHAEHRLGLDKLFPEMRVLNLSYTDGYIYDRHYANLVELNVIGSTAYNLGKLIQKNRQIKTLRVEDTTMGFLRFVNEKLPNLGTLAFHIPSGLESYLERPIHFYRVNDLTVTDFNHLVQKGKLSFKNLKRFNLLVKGNIKDEWINFIGSNKDLESLTITSGVFNDATLLSLSKKFNSLLEAKINCDKVVGVDSIADFMESNQHLKKITLNLEQVSTAYYKDLNNKLENQWRITPFTTMGGKLSTIFASKLEPYVEPAEEDDESDEDLEIIL